MVYTLDFFLGGGDFVDVFLSFVVLAYLYFFCVALR